MAPRHLAITMGDPAGIGPEIIAKAVAKLHDRIRTGSLRLLVIGSCPVLEQARARFAPDIAIPEVQESDAAWPALCALQAGPEAAKSRTNPSRERVQSELPVRPKTSASTTRI